jgi:outer membrane protein assembly factor BamA
MKHRAPISRLLAGLALVLLGLALTTPRALAQRAPDRVLQVESIEVTPTDAGLAAAVADLIGLRPGDPVDAERLQIARRDLRASGWFDRVEVYTSRGSQPGQLVVRVDADLDHGVHFESGLTHDPLESWGFRIAGLRAHHVLGAGSTGQLGFVVGPRRSMIEAEIEAPHIAGLNFDLLLRGRAGTMRWDIFEGENFYRQEITRSEFKLGGRWRLTRNGTVTAWLGGSSLEPGSVDQREGDRADPPAILEAQDFGKEDFTDFGLDLTLDRRDPTQPWRRGLWATVRLKESFRNTGASFGEVRAALRGAVPLPGQQALALRVDGTWTDSDTPYSLRPFFGGQGSVRGFRNASLSGALGARSTFAAGLEWRAPLFARGDRDARVHGVLFGDIGTWEDSFGEAQDWSSSVGWGLRVRVPWIERLSIDMALPLTPTATGDPFWVHGSLGFGF